MSLDLSNSNGIDESESLNHSWSWQEWEGLPYLSCHLLQDWQHGFFTQQFWPRFPETLTDVLYPDARTYRVKQVHSNRVLIPSEIEAAIEKQNGEITLSPADGIVTESTQQAVWVATADCTPALIGDVQTGKVAAVHAGWRGTAQKIIPEAIARLVAHGSSLTNLRVALGPAITGEVYQVTEHVAAEVGASIIPNSQAPNPTAILETLKELPLSPLLDDPQPGKVRLDVRKVNLLQLEQLGLNSQQIAIAPYCTYQEPTHFFSYRRSKEKKVQWSGIVSK